MRKNRVLAISVIALSLGLGGCKSMKNDAVSSSSDHSSQVAQLKSKISSQASALKKARRQLREKSSQSGASCDVEALCGSSNGRSSNSLTSGASSSMLPPNAKAGECYARVLIPAKYKTITKDVVKRNASKKIEVIPATYETVTEQVLVRGESESIKTIPAVYSWVEEQILVSAESSKLVGHPAQYGTESEQILVKPAYSTWKKGRGPIEKVNGSTGEIMCLVEVPAQYRTVTTRVVTKPAWTETIVIPAVYKTVKKKVMSEPPRVVRSPIPAKYKNVNVRKMVNPPRENVINIPAVYDTVVQQEKISNAEMKWQPILCETNTTSDIVFRIQKALDKAGYNPGSIDGVLGGATMSALTAYQKANGMAAGQLTVRALKKLGIL